MATPLRIDAKALRRYRHLRGLTLQSLAERAGLGTTTISRLESGTGELQVTTLAALADALSVEIADLLYGDAA